MGWLYVLGAGVVEIFWVLGLKYSSTLWHWAATTFFIVVSFYLIIKACERLPAGSVYAVFTGLGAAGIVLVDLLIFAAPFSWIKLALIGLIITGIIGIRLTAEPEKQTDDGQEIIKMPTDNMGGCAK